jgi:hypothetical protein
MKVHKIDLKKPEYRVCNVLMELNHVEKKHYDIVRLSTLVETFIYLNIDKVEFYEENNNAYAGFKKKHFFEWVEECLSVKPVRSLDGRLFKSIGISQLDMYFYKVDSWLITIGKNIGSGSIESFLKKNNNCVYAPLLYAFYSKFIKQK